MVRPCVVALVCGLALAGCGGSSRSIDVAQLEQSIKADAEFKLAVYDEQVASVSCVRDEDRWHFRCIIDASTADGVADQHVVKATCDSSAGGTCLWNEEP